jgi:hypothetical protein
MGRDEQVPQSECNRYRALAPQAHRLLRDLERAMSGQFPLGNTFDPHREEGTT